MGFLQLIPGLPSVSNPDLTRMAQWLRHFDAEFYRTHAHADGEADLLGLDVPALYQHFVETGWREGRSYSRLLHAFLDPSFYQRRYPELNLREPREAVRHWMFEGFYEGRIPNGVTQRILDSQLHLFQFGKVGSKAIERALYAAGHRELVLHLHWPNDLVSTYPDCIFSYQEVLEREPKKKIRFITGVRDPFARIVSGFFETRFSSRTSERSITEEDAALHDAIIAYFFRSRAIDHILTWFDHCFFRNVDVYAWPFDPAAGYQVISTPDTEVFVYRHEDLPHVVRPLSDFVGLDLRLERVNDASVKPYASAYRSVLERVRFAEEDVEHVVNSTLVRHFYSEREIDTMRERWSH